MNCCNEGNEASWNGNEFRGPYRYEIIPDSSAPARE